MCGRTLEEDEDQCKQDQVVYPRRDPTMHAVIALAAESAQEWKIPAVKMIAAESAKDWNIVGDKQVDSTWVTVKG